MNQHQPLKLIRANVVKHRNDGAQDASQKGTRHFRSRAKVYVIDAFWGVCDGVTVIGHHRASGRYVKLIMPVRHLEHFRLEVVHSPTVLSLTENHFAGREPYDETYGQQLLEALPKWQQL
jgi:hypothetical protein